MPKPKIKTREDEQIEKFVKHLEAEDKKRYEVKFDSKVTARYSADSMVTARYSAEDKKRYEVKFDSKVTARYSADSMVTARYSADVEMIQTYDMDIRKILEDQILKDMDIPKELMHGRQNR